jgi:hypothetical protein
VKHLINKLFSGNEDIIKYLNLKIPIASELIGACEN